MTQDRAGLLAELAAELQRADGESLTVKAMVARTLDLLPDADFASLTIRARRHRFVTLGTTDDRAEQADHLQYALGEGPCVSAAENAEWYRSGDVSVDPRWPAWGPRVAEAVGIHSLLSVRLIGETEAIGALNIYALAPGAFVDPREIDLALLFATHAAIALSAARQVQGLQTAVHSRHAIGIAQGILMERFDLDAEQAFALLRRYSNGLNVKLHEVSQEIAETRTLPTLPD